MQNREIIITAPSLDVCDNVSGVGAVVRFIIDSNKEKNYIHFRVGRKDCEANNLFNGILRNIKTYFLWKRFLREHSDAIIHYNYPLDAKSIVRDFFMMRFAVRHSRKMLIHVHGGLYLNKERCPWFIKRILKVVFSWNYPKIVLSDLERDLLQTKYCAKDVEILPNCVPLDDASVYIKKLKGKTSLDLLYIGRIEKNKGVDEIIGACKELKKRAFPFVLHIAGKEQTNDEYLPKMRRVLDDNFVYEGIVSGREKSELFKKCDVFMLPSYYEGLPMSLIESMSYGLIPVCTNVGSISTVVCDGENGFFVPQKDYESIVKAIEYLYANDDMAEEMSARAKKKIFDNFSPFKYIEKLNAIYDELKLITV